MTRLPSRPAYLPAAQAVALAVVLAASGCSSIENLVSGDKVDYKTTGTKTNGLEVPPDLTQLSRDARYQNQGGSISASAFQAAAAASEPGGAVPVAAKQIGDLHIERLGNQRWLSTTLPPEKLWAELENFWRDNGFILTVDRADIGVLETEWAENRAKLPKDPIRGLIGKVFDSLYSTGERDKFRTRVERSATGGSEVYITHRGMEEVYTSQSKDATVWQPRPADPQIEGEFLSKLMVRLGAKEDQAKTAVAATSTPNAPRARLLEGRPAASLQVDDSFERAWRRVGLALDRSGFTVEDRDRAQGLYFVRYVDPSSTGKEEPGFFSKLFTFGGKSESTGPARYRVALKGEGSGTTVSVLNADGAPENGANGKRIVALLVDDLK